MYVLWITCYRFFLYLCLFVCLSDCWCMYTIVQSCVHMHIYVGVCGCEIGGA